MSPNSSFFTETKAPFQKEYGGVVFPAILSSTVSPSAFAAAVKEQKTWVESLLHKHGAILFRGLGSSATASDFNDVVEAFGYEEMPYVGGAAPRSQVEGRVYTANEAPPHMKISFHHEMAYSPVHPRKIFLFCEEPAASGGETPIVVSHVVYERMKEKHRGFVEKLEKVGLIYTKVMGENDDADISAAGRGWKSTFRTNDPKIAEQRAAMVGMKLEWMEINGYVKTIMGPVPAIKCDETRQRKTWFNAMTAAYAASDGVINNDPKKAVTLGDGDPLPENIIEDCQKIMDEESVEIPWEKGDVLMIDNLAVLHGRQPFTPPRRVLAALCK